MKLLRQSTLHKKLVQLKVLLVLGGLLVSNLSFGQTCDLTSAGGEFSDPPTAGFSTAVDGDVLCITGLVTVSADTDFTANGALTIIVKNGGTLELVASPGFTFGPVELSLAAGSLIIIESGGQVISSGGISAGLNSITIDGVVAYWEGFGPIGDGDTVTGPATITPGGTVVFGQLFSRANSSWNTNGTWSLTSGGASCGCTPTATDIVTIEAHTIDFTAAGEAADLTIQSGGTLRWTANVILTIRNTGDITVDAGGTINRNANDADIAFDNSLGAGAATLTNNGSISIRDILIEGTDPVLLTNNSTLSLSRHIDINSTSNVTIEGSSDINISRHIRFDAINIQVINNSTGNLILRDVFFNRTGGTFENNGTILGRRIRVNNGNDDNNILTNNSTISLSEDIDTGLADFTLDNNGTINQAGIFNNVVTASTFNNNAGASWNYGGATFDPDVRLFCDNAINTFTYTLTGDQDIITPQDAYWNLTLSGSGAKTLQGDINIRGNYTISDGSAVSLVFGINTVTLNGTTQQTVDYTSNASNMAFYNLTINNTSGVTPAIIFGSTTINLLVNNNMTFTEGVVDVTATSFGSFFQSGSSVSPIGGATNSYIDGSVSKVGTTDFIFPIGEGTKWARLGISNLSASETFTAEYNETGYSDITVTGLSHVSGYEHWTLTRSGSQTATVTLYWEDGSPTGSDITDIGPTDLVVASYDGADWVSEGQVTPIPGSTAAGNVTSVANVAANYSVFTFGSLTGINPLPIELASFEGKQESTLVRLNWETASELNNDFFTLRRSYDGEEFEIIATIAGAGNSNKSLRYSFEDLPSKSGVIYYQLSQTDFDGTSETFDIIGVRYESSSDLIQVYPNPLSGDELTVLLPGEPSGKVVINIYSLTGEVIFQQEYIDPENKIILNLNDRKSKGIYLLKIITETKGFTSKLYLE